MLDGGIPLTGVLEQFNESTWNAFQKEFLKANKQITASHHCDYINNGERKRKPNGFIMSADLKSN